MIKEFLLNIKSFEFKNIKKDLDEYCMLLYSSDFYAIEKNYKKLTTSLENIKNFAIKKNEEDFANTTFVVKLYINLIYSYSKFLQEIKAINYKGSWYLLQDCIDYLDMYSKYESSKSIKKLINYFEKIEKLYPYKVFCSIEAKFSNITCSICGRDILDPLCNHRAGNIYFGEMCNEVVGKIDRLDAVAVVTKPQDKRCILELKEDNNENKFNLIKSMQSLLLKPLNDFIITVDSKPKVVNKKIMGKGKLLVSPTSQIKITINNMY